MEIAPTRPEQKMERRVLGTLLALPIFGYGVARVLVGGWFGLVGAVFSMPSSGEGGMFPTRDAATIADTRTFTVGALTAALAGLVIIGCTATALFTPPTPTRIAVATAALVSVLAHAVVAIVAGLTDTGSLVSYAAITAAALVELALLALIAFARWR